VASTGEDGGRVDFSQNSDIISNLINEVYLGSITVFENIEKFCPTGFK
jgi:hypothetical protein